MPVPNRNDFDLYTGEKVTGAQWNNSRDQIVAYLTDGTYDITVNSLTGDVTGDVRKTFSTLTAGENLTAGDVVRIASGQVYKADNTTSAGITNVVGVCKTTVSSGGTVTIDYGFYNSFSSLTAGTIYYIGTSAGITSTKPSLYPVEIGRAVSGTRINFNFKEDDKPTGTIITTALTSAPKGYLECNGSAVSRTTHARLFGELGVIYGDGDESTTFNLPDYRGRFLRGFDNTAGTDPDAGSRTDRGDGTTGDAVGTIQNDEFKSHSHSMGRHTGSSSFYRLSWLQRFSSSPVSTAQGTDATGGNETRPININVMYCIKL